MQRSMCVMLLEIRGCAKDILASKCLDYRAEDLVSVAGIQVVCPNLLHAELLKRNLRSYFLRAGNLD